MRNFSATALLSVLIVAAQVAYPASPDHQPARDARVKTDREDLRAPARERGEIRVIVSLDNAQDANAQGDQTKAQSVSNRQARVLQRLVGRNTRDVRRLRLHHVMALTVDSTALEALLADPEVTGIALDEPRGPVLIDTPGITGATAAWAAGVRGAGQAVAILDTGVDSTHPFFAGKVVAEACFSNPVAGNTSYCPGGAIQSTAAGSGAPCPDNDKACWHGTHVAGIAAGRSGVLGSTSGIAPEAGVIAIQVFQRAPGGLPAYDSDILAALDYVYSLRNTFSIAAVNMSLGGSTIYSTTCDATFPAYKTVIDSLRVQNIATVIASGNSGSTTGVSAPACVSSAIRVGSTTKQNTVSSFSNSSSLVSLLAPGGSVTSSVPLAVSSSGFLTASGTSMATPHVAGAWALVRSASTAATVSEVLAALQNTGVPITDGRNGVTKSLIRISSTQTQAGALGQLPSRSAPAVTLTSPTGGTPFIAPADITVDAAASTTVAGATISRVEFFRDTTKITEATGAPYSFVWSGVPEGSYRLTARATDSTGGIASSGPVTVVVAPYRIAGRITDANGPLAGVSLSAPGATCSQTDGAGNYFCAVLQGWTGTVRPTGYIFSPPSRSYTSPVTADQTGQDYVATAGVWSTDVVWVEDTVPAGAILAGDGEAWNWTSANPAPFSGTLAHQSALATGTHQHYFYNASNTLAVGTGETLSAYVYLDSASPPREVMLQWNDGSWEHRAYWGANLIGWGTDGTVSRRYMGPLPPAGQWVRLEVPAAAVGLEGRTLNGMAFTLYDGRATWDRAGKVPVGNLSIGGIVTAGSSPLAGVSFAAGAGVTCSNSNTSGQYDCTVPQGWTGIVTPSYSGYSFTPSSRSYTSPVTTNQTGQNFTAAAITFTLSGTVNAGGSTLAGVSFSGGAGVSCSNSTTSGQYSCIVPQGWTGTITPSSSGYSFTPQSRTYTSPVTANQTGQNFAAASITLTLSGTVSTSGSALTGVSFVGGAGVNCTNSNPSGQYSCTVPQSWTGTITPSLSGYSFNPASRTYTSPVIANQAGQDYLAAAAAGSPDIVWVEDAAPAGAALTGFGESWNWISANPAPFSGSLAHQSALVNGTHQHYFTGASSALAVGSGDTLFAYIYLDPANPPSEVMLQWNEGGSWEHRAYWGSDLIGWGTDGTVSSRYMGALPPAGQWVRLEVPAALVGLEGRMLNGMAFTLYNGRATWDRAGKAAAATAPTYAVSGTVSTSGSALTGVSFAGGAGVNCTNSNPSGQYSCTVPQSWTGTITPSLSGYSFNPASHTYTSPVIANQAGQDYLAAAAAGSPDIVWVEDAAPAGAALTGFGESWNWISANPAPFSGSLAHQSALVNGTHQHYFTGASSALAVGSGDTLFAYIYLDPANPPSEVMLQWNEGGSWEHRAYWGSDLIGWGTDGTVSRRYMGALPPAGQWVRLEVPAALVGLEGRMLNGMAFTLYNGRATWDRAGKTTQ